MFRRVELPAAVPGRLFLHGMPGLREPWAVFADQVAVQGIGTIVCLTPPAEIERASPAYARARVDGSVPARVEDFPIGNLSAPEPERREAFARLVVEIADRLRGGERVLVHCGAGIGRTGTFAVCVLQALGVDPDDAARCVEAVGSHPETPAQAALVRWCARRLAPPEATSD